MIAESFEMALSTFVAREEGRIETYPVPAHTSIFRERRKPGPVSADTPIDHERDLADAALILQLMDKGALKSSYDEFTANEQLPLDAKSKSRLTEEEEVELTKRVQICGDIDARNALVMANIGLVHLVANQMCRPPFRYEDLLQEGIIGLMRATQSYEPFRNVRFSTYSVYWIRAKIQRHIQRFDKDDLPGIAGASPQIDAEGKTHKPRSRKLSLEKKLESSENRTLGETISANTDDPEAVALKRERIKLLHEALKESVEELGDPRLYTIIKLRLLADVPVTLEELGKTIQISREGARMLEARLLQKTKEKIKSLKRRPVASES
jgi:RNA polymerase sigma factor (sigma-70 family)